MKIFLIRIRLSKLTVISGLRQALLKCCYRVIRDLSICCLLYLLFGLNGSVTGLRAEGDFTFTMEWNVGRLTQCAVTSGHGGECRIYCPAVRWLKVENSKGEEVTVSSVDKDLISFFTVKGETYSFPY